MYGIAAMQYVVKLYQEGIKLNHSVDESLEDKIRNVLCRLGWPT
jgi:hypothetical protein